VVDGDGRTENKSIYGQQSRTEKPSILAAAPPLRFFCALTFLQPQLGPALDFGVSETTA
jgi:hypothetical protein